MLIIEKNKIYEKIKEEDEKIKSFEQYFFISMSFSLVNMFFFMVLFNKILNNQSMLDFLFSLFVIIFPIYLSFISIRASYKSCNYVEYCKKELNKIYEPDVFIKISEELILLDKNNNISLINKDLINEILEHKKEKIEMTENLKILKTVAQEIENT